MVTTRHAWGNTIHSHLNNPGSEEKTDEGTTLTANDRESTRGVVLFVALTLGISYAVVLPCYLLGWDWNVVMPLRLIVVFAPALAAVITTQIVHGEAGLERMFASFRKGAAIRWFVLSLTLFIALALLACGIRYAIDGTPVAWTGKHPATVVLGWIPLFLLPGVAEEPGWRGFLQPRLQRWLSPPLAGLGVGFVWGAWHAHDALMQPQRFGALTVWHFVLFVIGCSVIIGWLYHASGGSVWIAMTAHLGSNLVWSVLDIYPRPGQDPLTVFIYVGLIWSVALTLIAISFRKTANPQRA